MNQSDQGALKAAEIERELRASFFRKNRLLFAANIIVRLGSVAFELLFSLSAMYIMDALAQQSFDLFRVGIMLMIASVASQMFSSLLRSWVYPRFLSRCIAHYREAAFDLLLNKELGALDDGGAEVYLSALTNDVQTLEAKYYSRLFLFIEQALLFVSSGALLVWVNPLLALLAFVAAVFPLGAGVLVGDKLEEQAQRVSEAASRLVASLTDLIGGFSVIKGFGAERRASARFAQTNEGYALASRKSNTVECLVELFGITSHIIASASVLCVGSWLCFTGVPGVTVGSVTLAVNTMNNLANPLHYLPIALGSRKTAGGLVSKLAHALASDTGSDNGMAIARPLSEGIRFTDVSFAYPDGPTVLDGLSFSIPAGSCYAIVGASGSGKSTALSLLSGARSGYEGHVTYDGADVASISAASLFDAVSLVRQDVFLFDATLKENVTMFADFDDEAIDRAVTMAGLDALVAEKGLDAPCGAGGSNLSGGERQRVSLARSLLRGAEVLLLDEVTSALDANTADHIVRSLLALTQTTRVIVTHRLDAAHLAQFDGIIVLKDGRAIETGTFDALMAEDGYFKALYTVTAES